MATQELRKRANWQTISGAKALGTEKLFQKSLQSALDSVYPGQFVVDRHPKEFGDIYSTYDLPQEVLDKIYNVDVTAKKANGKPKYQWGISMDFAIRNITNGKILFGEIKRQDGWIETTNMQAGRGNAHERSCKYFTPGLMKVIRETGGLSDEILPFWLVIVGDITRDPRRNREIAFWFQNYTKNGSVKNFVALVKNGSFLVRITDMTILIEKEFIYGSSKRPNPTDYYRKQHYQCG